MGSIKVQKYSAFLREIVVPTNFNIMAVRPLRGSGLVVCEPTLVFSGHRCAVWRGGAPHPASRGAISATEQRIIRHLVDVITEEYKKSWQGIPDRAGLPALGDAAAEFATVATPGEIVVCCSFTLEIGDATGTIDICIPYATFEPIRDILFSSIQGDWWSPAPLLLG